MASRLLVADDSTTIQKIISMAFENEDVEVEGVGDGQEAFDRIVEFNPDIVLADVDMPGLDGFELSAKIKKSPETSGVKVLLLAGDFEDFDEQRFQACGANNYISKPFKSDDIVTMVKGLLEGGDDIALPSDVDLKKENSFGPASVEIIEQAQDETEAVSGVLEKLQVPEPQEEPSLEELLESVEKLSSDGTETPELEDAGEQEEETRALMNEELELLDDPLGSELEEEAPVAALENDDDIMDQMIRGVEELKESVQPSEPSLGEGDGFSFEEPESGELDNCTTEESEIFAEVRPRKMDDMDDLDSAFKELSMGGRPRPADQEEKRPELSSLGGIVPEPEDLLEQMAPGAFSEVGKRPSTPEDIKENLAYIAGFSDQGNAQDLDPHNLGSRDWSYDSGDDLFTQAIAEEVKQLLKRSLGASLEKEVYGLSDAILKTIREVVREVTPEIASRVIREEIEKIKKQDMC
jgi:CheY-like chemotaxis protein